MFFPLFFFDHLLILIHILNYLYLYLIYLYFLISSIIEQIFNPTAEVAIPTGTQTNEVNTETKTLPLTAEIKQENVQSNLKPHTHFYAFHSLNLYVLFHLKDNFIYFF